jgi:hypothetical protein
MLPVRVIGGTREGGAARESKNDSTRKKERSAHGGIAEETLACLGRNASARASLEDHGQRRYAWRENEIASGHAT